MYNWRGKGAKARKEEKELMEGWKGDILGKILSLLKFDSLHGQFIVLSVEVLCVCMIRLGPRYGSSNSSFTQNNFSSRLRK